MIFFVLEFFCSTETRIKIVSHGNPEMRPGQSTTEREESTE